MEPGLTRDVLTVVVGLFTGVLSAAFGVGGAVVSTPGIRALGASALVAVGTTLPSIFPSAVSGTVRYVKDGLVDWRVVRWVASIGVAFSVLGSLLSHAVPGDGHPLMLMTAAFLGWTAYRMATRPSASTRPGEAHVRRNDSPLLMGAVGCAAGLLSGLLGIGGGVIMVPGFTQLIGMRLKRGIATSLVCVGILAVPGTVTHAGLGDIDWRFALLLAVAVVPGARLGAAFAIRSSDRRLRLTVATFLGLTAVLYAGGEIVALLR